MSVDEIAHLRELMNANDKRYAERFEAQQKAIEKAELASEKRFEGVNEFRATLADQQRSLMPRQEAEVLIRALNDKLASLKERVDGQTAERVGVKGGWGFAIGAIGLVLLVVSIIGWLLRIGGAP